MSIINSALSPRSCLLAAALALALPACASEDAAAPLPPVAPALPDGVAEARVAADGGGSIRYLIGGEGSPVLLLNGWPQSSYEWRAVLPRLMASHTVIAADLPGTGESDIPDGGYDKRTTARRLRKLVHQLGLGSGPISIVGHDIGAMVGLAYAAEFPAEVAALVFMEAPPPSDVFYQLPAYAPAEGGGVWWFGLHDTELAEELIVGRERAYYSWFFRSLAGPNALDDAAIDEYVRTGSGPARVTAGLAYYRAFAQDIADNRALAAQPLALPVIAIGGEYAMGPVVGQLLQPFARDVTPVVIAGSGHWIPEEQPAALAERLLAVLP